MKDSVPISGRVTSDVANEIMKKAEKLGLTLSKTVGLLLSDYVSKKNEQKEKCELVNDKWREVTGALINEFAKSKNEQSQMIDFVSTKIEQL